MTRASHENTFNHEDYWLLLGWLVGHVGYRTDVLITCTVRVFSFSEHLLKYYVYMYMRVHMVRPKQVLIHLL